MSNRKIEEVSSRKPNSTDYWRRRRGLTWKELAGKVGCQYPALVRFWKHSGHQTRSGGGIGPEKRDKLAQALDVELWQLFVPEENAEKNFGKINPNGLT